MNATDRHFKVSRPDIPRVVGEVVDDFFFLQFGNDWSVLQLAFSTNCRGLDGECERLIVVFLCLV